MAIDPAVPRDVANVYVKPNKTFFPAKIPVNHNQLRHIISSPRTNYLFYAKLRDVYCVDLSTNTRSHVQELPFEARCTATAHGFFCAGDERGYFAFIPLPESISTRSFSPTDSVQDDASSFSPRPGVRVEHPGGDIMNSISIHKISHPAPGIASDTVAVLTNNDKFVRLFSLTREIVIDVDEYSWAMNHASISPDGMRLAVVGDHEYLKLYRRTNHTKHYRWKDPSREMCYTYEHQLTFPLHKPNASSSSAYFTTAWSPNGRLCATASEDGYITLLNVDALDEVEDGADPVVTVVPSSRPNTTPGAVRTMAFSPEPWDLLIWVENFGRVCVGDLRQALLTREIVKLDSSANGVERVELEDVDEAEASPDVQNHLEHVSTLPLWVLARRAASMIRSLTIRQQERRRRGELGADQDLSTLAHGLTEHERQVLENLRITRRREEALNNSSEEALAILRRHSAQSRPSPRSITYNPSQRNQDESRELSRLLPSWMVLGADPFQATASTSPQYTQELPRSLLLGDQNRVTQSPRRTTDDSSDPWHTIEAAIDNASSGETYASIASRYLRWSNRDLPGEPNVTDPSLSNTNLPSTATGVTLPSLRERLPELSELNASLRTLDDAQRRRNMMWRGLSRQLARDEESPRPLQRASDAAGRARDELIRARDLERINAGRNSVFLRNDSGALRRLGMRMAASEAAQFSRVYGIPMSEEEEVEMGDGTTGVALGDGGRQLYVGTETGIWVLDMDFAARKGREVYEFA